MHRASLVSVNGGASLVVVHRLLIAGTSLAVRHKLQSAQAPDCRDFACCGAQAAGCTGSVVVPHELSCPEASRIFPDPGSNLCPLIDS